MPRKAIDYSKCCIYKIEHLEDENLVYVGHTTNWDKRKCEHKSYCNNENSSNYNLKLYQMIRTNGGWYNFKMIEVEKYPCNDRREAEKRENEVMKLLKSNMNTYKSYATKEDRLEQYRKYHKNNREIRNEKRKEHYKNNYEQTLEHRKEYNKNNVERISEKNKEYYKRNKHNIQEKHKEKIVCVCGCEITKTFLKKHQLSKKHLNLIEAL